MSAGSIKSFNPTTIATASRGAILLLGVTPRSERPRGHSGRDPGRRTSESASCQVYNPRNGAAPNRRCRLPSHLRRGPHGEQRHTGEPDVRTAWSSSERVRIQSSGRTSRRSEGAVARSPAGGAVREAQNGDSKAQKLMMTPDTNANLPIASCIADVFTSPASRVWAHHRTIHAALFSEIPKE